MKFGPLYVVSLLLLSSGLFAQKTDAESFGLKGKVKSMTWTTICQKHDQDKNEHCRDRKTVVYFDEHGNKIKSHTDKMLDDSIVRNYNEKGQLIKQEIYLNKVREIVVYHYNADNGLEEEAWAYDHDLRGKKSTSFKYDNKGRVISEEDKYDDSTQDKYFLYTYKLNNKDSVIERKKTDQKSHNVSLDKYSYDRHGYVKKRSFYENARLISSDVYVNDERGNHLKCTHVNNGINGSFTLNTTMKYDAHNNCIEYKYNNKTAKLQGTVTTEYEYDSFGNWLKETITKNGAVESVSTRMIEYY